MIQYEPAESPFYEANRKYCESVEQSLKEQGIECTGFCNSYGYEVVAKFDKNSQKFTLRLIRHQTAENGVVIPVNANDYAGCEIHVSGLNSSWNISYGKSVLKRFFSPVKFRNELPNPYFLRSKGINPALEAVLLKLVKDEKVSGLNLKQGHAEIKFHEPLPNPLDFIDNFNQLTGSSNLSGSMS